MKLTHLTRGISWDAMKEKCSKRQLEVIQLLELHGPLTAFEMAKKAGKPHRSYYAPRCTELSTMKAIITLDATRIDPDTGKPSVVYALPFVETTLIPRFQGRQKQGTFGMGEAA